MRAVADAVATNRPPGKVWATTAPEYTSQRRRRREGETGEQDDHATHFARIAPGQRNKGAIIPTALKAPWTRNAG